MSIDDEIHKLQQECGCEAAAAVLLIGLAFTVCSVFVWSWIAGAIALPLTFIAMGAAKLLIVQRAQRKAARLIAQHD